MNEYEARITRLERELAALRAASAEMVAAYNEWNTAHMEDEFEAAYERLELAKAALKALLAEGETDGNV